MKLTLEDIVVFVTIRHLRSKYQQLVGHFYPATPSFMNEVIQHHAEGVQQDIVQQTQLEDNRISDSLKRYAKLTKHMNAYQWKAFDTILGSYETVKKIYQGDVNTCIRIVNNTLDTLHEFFRLK